MNLDELERVAKEAAPTGEWWWDSEGNKVGIEAERPPNDRNFLLWFVMPKRAKTWESVVPLADYIAAFNPQTALALIERLRLAEEVVDASPSNWTLVVNYRTRYPKEKA